MKTLELFTDGACQGNPGEAAVGVVIKENGKVIKEISKPIGQATNNIAEYTAVIYGLQEALILKAQKVTINTDSELLYHQIKGSYKIKHPNLKFLFDLVQHLSEGFKSLEYNIIPREKNQEADKLATQAIQKEQALPAGRQTKMVAPMLNFGEESPSSAG